MIVLWYSTLLLGLAFGLSALAGVLWFFRMPDAGEASKVIPRLVSLTYVVVYGGALIAAWFSRSRGPHTLSSVGLVFSLSLFWSAWFAHGIQRPNAIGLPQPAEDICQRGPYRFIRHPFYASYILGASSLLLHSIPIWVATGVVVVIAMYWREARSEERKILPSSLGPTYQEYVNRTGMFFPRIIC